jgi:hypothetical protein
MDSQQLLLIAFGIVVILSLMLGAWSRRRDSASLVSFFWADNSFSVSEGTHLNLSSSFSTNGILYSAWLGYKAGWASVLPQIVWCLGFLFLARYSSRLSHISRTGTLHGNIGYVFGASAARWAAIASIVGYTLLFGWELYIGSSIIRAFTPGHSAAVETIIYFSLATITAIYCTVGGLRGNLRANEFQNYLSGGAAVAAIIYLGWFVSSTAHFRWHDFIDLSTLPALTTELTWAGILTNAVLFTVYQFLDMSNWENIAALSEGGDKTKSTLWASAFWILLFPGVAGSALGMVMRSSTVGVTADNLIPLILQKVSGSPVIFLVLVAGFFAMMLSTVDGLLLAACQALSWDLIDRKRVLRILTSRGTADFAPDDLTMPSALYDVLASRTTPLTEHLWDSVAPEIKLQLKKLRQTEGQARALSVLLARELNALIVRSPLFEEHRFQNVHISQEARELLAANPTQILSVLLNRWLLEDAFPEAITYNQYSGIMRHERLALEKITSQAPIEIQEQELAVLDRAKYGIFLLAIAGGASTLYVVRAFGVNSFNLLYITYVAQMSLFPAIWVIVHGEKRKQPRGALSIGIGLAAGMAAVVYGLTLNAGVATWAPVVAIFVACLFYWPFRRFPKSTVDIE